MRKLIYQGRSDDDPVFVEADVISSHPDRTVTFRITDLAFLGRIGYGPSAYVERQASPVPRVRASDRFYWAEYGSPE